MQLNNLLKRGPHSDFSSPTSCRSKCLKYVNVSGRTGVFPMHAAAFLSSKFAGNVIVSIFLSIAVSWHLPCWFFVKAKGFFYKQCCGSSFDFFNLKLKSAHLTLIKLESFRILALHMAFHGRRFH